MSRADLQAFVQELTQKLGGGAAGLSDGQLLQRWLSSRDEAAFELLLRRHGPLVLGLCRRLLRDPRDVDDAFQAVFLTLLRKASRLRDHRALAAWLYRVAYRICLRALKDRRTDTAPLAEDEVAARPETDELLWRDLRPVLDAEVNALPERYRVPFVLCHLQGKTNQEAADALGCPVGTVLSRLHWARERLRSRLTRRGIAVSVAALAALSGSALAVDVPAVLIDSTLRVLSPVTGAVSARAAALSEGVLRAMLLNKVKGMSVAVAAVALLSLGTWGLLHRADATPAPRPADKPAPPSKAKPEETDEGPKARDYVLVPAQQSGRILFLGRKVPPGEIKDEATMKKVALSVDRSFLAIETTQKELADLKVPGHKMLGDDRLWREWRRDEDPIEPNRMNIVRVREWYYPLKEGTTVKEGELLGMIDPRLTEAELFIKIAKLTIAQAEAIASEKTRDEAKVRHERGQALLKNGGIGREEADGLRLTWERYVEEEKGKRASVEVARREIAQTDAVMRQHEIRSATDGVLRAILAREGEAVRALDPVLRVKPR